MDKRIAIVTDSTADLPPDLVAAHDIRVVPQILIVGDRTWLDGVEIDSPTFYDLLQTSPHFPSSSQPSVASFQAVFAELAKEADGIVAVLVSNELSGTVNSALTAAASLPEVPIEIVDSRAVSMQLGFLVLIAARAAEAGLGPEAVADAVRARIGQVEIYFVVDTLEYLHRGGRIGGAARLFGTALNLKPVLKIEDGAVCPVAKIRTRRKALARLDQIVEEHVASAGGGEVHLGILHIAAPDEAAHLAEKFERRFQPAALFQTECGPVIGTHAGPGTIGVAFYVE